LVGIDAVVVAVTLSSHRLEIHTIDRRAYRAHCVKNVTSSAKPEVHIVSQRRQRRTESRPQSTYT